MNSKFVMKVQTYSTSFSNNKYYTKQCLKQITFPRLSATVRLHSLAEITRSQKSLVDLRNVRFLFAQPQRFDFEVNEARTNRVFQERKAEVPVDLTKLNVRSFPAVNYLKQKKFFFERN